MPPLEKRKYVILLIFSPTFGKKRPYSCYVGLVTARSNLARVEPFRVVHQPTTIPAKSISIASRTCARTSTIRHLVGIGRWAYVVLIVDVTPGCFVAHRQPVSVKDISLDLR